MRKILYILVIVSFLCSSALYARNVTEVNWPEESVETIVSEEDETAGFNERNAYIEEILPSLQKSITDYIFGEDAVLVTGNMSEDVIEEEGYIFSSSATGGSSTVTIDDDATDTSPCPSGPPAFTHGPDHSENIPTSPPAPPLHIIDGPCYEAYGNALEMPDSSAHKRVILELKDDANTECLSVLKEMGCKVEVYVFNLVQVTIDERRLDYLKELNFVNHLRFPTESENNSKYLSGAPTIGLTDFSALNLN